MYFISWLQANSATLWFAASIAAVVALWLYRRYLQSGQNGQAFAQQLATEAIAAALVAVKGAADQIEREDLDNVVAFLYLRVPIGLQAIVPVSVVQDQAWVLFQKLHAELDADRKAQIVNVVYNGRAARGGVA